MAEHEQAEAFTAVGGETVELAAAPTLASRVADAMAETEAVSKTGENKDQGYKFASAEAILSAARGPLLARGIALMPSVLGVDEQEIQSRGGAKGSRVIIHVRFTFTDGREMLVQDWRGEGQDYGDKAYGKAYTNAVKTFIRTAWMLPTEHDDPEASDPGQRHAVDQPAWQRPASPARRDELNALIGETAAGALADQIEKAWGLLPDGAIAIVKALIPAAEPTAETDQAAKPGSIEVDLSTVQNDPAAALRILKANGCTCEDPLMQRSDTGDFDEACPIKGHYIPF